MSILKGPSDAGQGGKRGHSNMEHWETTEEIKEAARKRRRHEAKTEIQDGLVERGEQEVPESPQSNLKR